MIIVFGNTKGGTGKSTLAVHLSVALLYQGYRVACIDMDGDQGTLSRYLENRAHFNHHSQKKVPLANLHHRIYSKDSPKAVKKLLEEVSPQVDHIIIDTPGYDSDLSRYGHELANVLITPINDSGIDLDLLVNLQATPSSISESSISQPSVPSPPPQLPLSHYSTMVWQQRMNRAVQSKPALEWLVVRNRLHALCSRNQLEMHRILTALAKRIGFQLVGGMGERVIFRELFAYGLTVMDQTLFRGSQVAAQEEILLLMKAVLEVTP